VRICVLKVAQIVDGRWGFVSISGELVINPQFERAEVFAEGLAAIRLDKWGHVDGSGKFVINPQFDEAASFANGLARVKMGGRTGYINTTGNFIWNPAK